MTEDKTVSDDAIIDMIRRRLATEVKKASIAAHEQGAVDVGVDFWPEILPVHVHEARTLLHRDGAFAVNYEAPETESGQHGMNTGAVIGPQYDSIVFQTRPSSLSITSVK